MSATAYGRRALADVHHERLAQDAKWGEQNHPDGTGTACPIAWHGMADLARKKCDLAASLGLLTWRDILTEEFAEVMAAPDPTALRTELVQVAAVAVAWVEALDRRDGAR